MSEQKYWVEADRAVKDYNKVIGYGVWHFNEKGARECINRFAVTRKGGWEVALHLANTLRDDLLADQTHNPFAGTYRHPHNRHRGW